MDGIKIVGIKKVVKDEREYVTFYGTKAFSDYEVENSDFVLGLAVDIVSANEDFGVKIGDVVDFNYGKAITTAKGTFQPIKSVTFIKRADAPTK